jgi:hypothetical protein
MVEVEVGQSDGAAGLFGEGQRRVDGQRRRPHATLRGDKDEDLPAAGARRCTRRRRGQLRFRRSGRGGAQQQGIDDGFQLTRVEGVDEDVISARLEQPHPLLDLVGVGDGKHWRAWCAGDIGRLAQSLAEAHGRLVVRAIDDEQLVTRRLPRGRARVVDDRQQRSAGGQRRRDRLLGWSVDRQEKRPRRHAAGSLPPGWDQSGGL